MVQTLLLNSLIILVFTFSYQFFWLDKRRAPASNPYLISFLSSVVMVLCLSFPFRSQSGYMYDLRIVPLLISFFYGGYRSLAIVSLVYLAYRFYLGGDGVLSSAIVFFIMLPIIGNTAASFSQRSKSQKLLTGVTLTLLWVFTLISVKLYRDFHFAGYSDMSIEFWAAFILINVMTIWMTIYWFEGMLEKHRLELEIQRGEKMYALGQLAAAFAHEIRNPLTTVRGFIQVLLRDQIPEDRRRDYLQIMLQECDQAQSVITEYLSWAKPQTEETCPVDFSLVIERSIQLAIPYAQSHNVEIRSSIEPSVPITSNPDKIKQCLFHIMKNGIEAMTSGGLLEVHAGKKQGDLVVTIIDSGVGMTEEELDRLGMPYYSTKEKGTGLGTMVSYLIIESLHGKIDVTSEKGKGTCCTISLPIVPIKHEKPSL